MQTQQLTEAREKIDASLSNIYKPSVSLLDKRKVFERLIVQKKYAEAHDLKGEIEQMEIIEQQKFSANRETKITKAMELVMTKQVVERNSMAKKHEALKNDFVR